MAIKIQKARRSQAKIKIAIGGPAGSGKTMSSLLLAYGLIRAEHPELSQAECWDKVCIIDTENASGTLYVGNDVGTTHIGEYNVIPMEPPYDPSSFVEAIHAAEEADMEVIIIDSLSHAWVGEGGALDKQGAIAARSGNSYTAWRTVTPEHNRLVDAMLQSKCHVIADIRAKMEYQQSKSDSGKTQVKAIGMGLQMRDGIEYEFTIAFMLDPEHQCNATKDRTGLFDGKYFLITPDTGRKIVEWLSGGAPAAAPAPKPVTKTAPAPAPATPAPTPEPEPDPFAGFEPPAEETVSPAVPDPEPEITMAMLDKAIIAYTSSLSREERFAVGEKVQQIAGTKNYRAITDQAVIRKLYQMFS